jgi:WD40 repeat protein
MKLHTFVLIGISFILASCQLAKTQDVTIVSSTSTVPQSEKNVMLDFALSPDGSKIAVYLNSGVFIYDTHTLEKRMFKVFLSGDYSRLLSGAVAFSPDGRNIAISGKFADEHINIWDVESEKFVALISALPNGHFVTEIEFSPNNHSVFIRSTYPVSMLRCEKSEDSLELLVINRLPGEMSFSKSFEKYWCNYVPAEVFFTENDKMYVITKSLGLEYWIDIIDTNTGNIIQSQEYKYEDGNFLDISPNGSLIATTREENKQITTNVIDTNTGKTIVTIPYSVKFTRQEDMFLVRDTNGQWSNWENGKINCSYNGFSQHYPHWKFSKDGNYFAVERKGKIIEVWEISNCEKVNVLSFSE